MNSNFPQLRDNYKFMDSDKDSSESSEIDDFYFLDKKLDKEMNFSDDFDDKDSLYESLDESWKPLRKNAWRETVYYLKNKDKNTDIAFTTGSCCLFFILSSFLWIFLCKDLSDRNTLVTDIVYDHPTLGDIHDKYRDLY